MASDPPFFQRLVTSFVAQSQARRCVAPGQATKQAGHLARPFARAVAASHSQSTAQVASADGPGDAFTALFQVTDSRKRSQWCSGTG